MLVLSGTRPPPLMKLRYITADPEDRTPRGRLPSMELRQITTDNQSVRNRPVFNGVAADQRR